MNITKTEQKKLNDALWAIEEARNTILKINDDMEKERRWNGHADTHLMHTELTAFVHQFNWAKTA